MIKEIQIKKYKKPKSRILIHLLVLLAGISIVYFKAAKAPFVLDDIYKIVLNDDIKEGISPSKLLFQYKKRTDKIGHDLPSPDWDRNDPSRPLTYLSYTINYSLSGLKYISWHVFDFFLHFFIVLLIYFFLKKLTSLYLSPPPKILYFLPALIFAIHPAGTNTVSYAFARAGQLSALFYLLGLFSFISAAEKNKSFSIFPPLFYILALASKPDAVTLPAVIILIDYFFISKRDFSKFKNRFKTHIPLLLILILYFAFRYFFIGEIGDIEGGSGRWERLPYLMIQPYVFFKHLAILFNPSQVSFEHYIPYLTGLKDPRFLLYLPLLLLTMAGYYFFYFKKTVHKEAGIFFILFFLITVSPTSSIFPTTCPLAERYIYFPSIGIFALIALFIYEFLQSRFYGKLSPLLKKILITGGIFYLIALVAGGISRNILFADDILLWEDTIERYPDHARANFNLAGIYFDKQNYPNAEKYYLKVIDIHKRRGDEPVLAEFSKGHLELIEAITNPNPSFEGWISDNILQLILEVSKDQPEIKKNQDSSYFEGGWMDEALEQAFSRLSLIYREHLPPGENQRELTKEEFEYLNQLAQKGLFIEKDYDLVSDRRTVINFLKKRGLKKTLEKGQV